jgi:hypothetical protein
VWGRATLRLVRYSGWWSKNMAFAKLINSTAGRYLRIVAGTVMMGLGLFAIGGTAGLALAVIGVVPTAAGIFDVCLLAPVLSVPWSGKKIRAMR